MNRAGVLLLACCALAGCGGGEAPRSYERAVAALREGRLADAEAHAAAAAEAGGEAYGFLRSFVRGNVSFARSVAYEAEAARPGGDPEASKAALKLAEDALAYWRFAAASRADWPAARRNVERALLRLERLREKRNAGKGKPDGGPGTEPGDDQPPADPEPPEPPSDPTAPAPAEDPERPLETSELTEKEIEGLFDVLRRRNGEKQQVRRAQRRARSATVEKDW